MNVGEELKFIAQDLNEVLSRYIKIHNAVFKFSWRKIIPIPFIFEAIDFKGFHLQAEQILSELGTFNQQIDELIGSTEGNEAIFAQFLLDYCMALVLTVSLLEKILHQLHLKSEGSNEYNLEAFNLHCSLYRSSIEDYMNIGARLNELYQDLYGSSKSTKDKNWG